MARSNQRRGGKVGRGNSGGGRGGGGRGGGGRRSGVSTYMAAKSQMDSRRGGEGKASPHKARSTGSGGGSRKRFDDSRGRGNGGGGSRPRSQGRGGRGRGRQERSGKKEEKPVTAEELDAAMDDYWMKSGNKEIAAKKLDDDMDDYWAKKDDKAGDNTAGDGGAPAEDAKPEAASSGGMTTA